MTEGVSFKGQLSDEEVICTFRKHWISVLPRLSALFVLVVVTAIVIFFLGDLARFAKEEIAVRIGVIFGFVLLVGLVHNHFMGIFHYYLRTVQITSLRVVDVDRSIYFRDSKDSIDLAKIQDIQKHQNGILENILDFGSFNITLSGTHTSMNIKLVPHPEHYYKIIHRAKRDYIQRRQADRVLSSIGQEAPDFPIPVPVEG
ncbi:hypothetical protein KKC94_04600 [Patescibacteria group bacterium]|nr:hypothetical protein [Patescibacteria group bacterium]